jgi:uncharacterized protein YyaL (SSP411 family)
MDGTDVFSKITNDSRYRQINEQILAAEKKLLSVAPEAIKRLYFDIDSLVFKQREIIIELLKNN